MIDREKSPMKPLTSDRRACGSIQSSQYVILSENQNPNLGQINRVANLSGKSKTSVSITEPKTPNKSLVRTGKDEAQQVVTSESKEAGIAAPSPTRRHFCRSPRCASNNPDYAQPSSIPLRKFLVSKRHLLLQAKGEIPPPVPKSPAAALATLPHDQISGTLPPRATGGCVKETRGAEVEDTEGNLACRVSEEQCEFDQSQVMEFVMKQDEDTEGNLACRVSEEQREFVDQSHVMEFVMKQDDDICSPGKQDDDVCSHVKQDDDICSQQDDDMCPQQDDGICFALEEEGKEKEQSENNDINMSMHTCNSDPDESSSNCSRMGAFETPFLVNQTVEESAESAGKEGKQTEQSENNDINMPMHTCNSDPDENSSNCSSMGAFETPCLVNQTVEECELPSESTQSAASEELVALSISGECKDLVAMATSGKCQDFIWTSSCIEAVAPVDDTKQQHETAAVKTQAILEKKQSRGCRINKAIAEAHRKVSEPLGEGRVRHLVKAFENIISLAESEAEESRVIKSQGFEKAYHANAGRGVQAPAAAEDHHACEQSIACSSANLHEEVKLPAVPVKTMVDIYHSSKQSPIKSMITVKPLDENRLILQQAGESDHISGDKHLIETCFQATELTLGYDKLEHNIISKKELDDSTVEVKRMIDRYNVEMNSLAHARSIDKVRNWNAGESMHANVGYELWKKLLNSPHVVDRGYLIAHERVGMAEDGRVSQVRPTMAVDSKDANKKHDQGASTDDRKLGNIACKREINKEGCTTPPTRDDLGNEVDQASNFGVSLCNSFQSQRTGTSFGMHSRKSRSTCLQPFALRTEARGAKKKHEFARKLARMFAEEQRMRIPLAQGLPWTTDEPQALPKPPVKENTVPLEIQLFSDIRACERAEFDGYVAERISLMEQQRQERERLKQIAEQEEVKRLRREMVPRAQLMPYFDRPFMPKRSSKRLTIPKGPSFQCDQNKRHKCMATQG
ncbi:hypothetical protein O6H91_18G049800 [Diphasiastrum complanatum]|uniref:Uncharacterized protein n=4 Tax=Diphasiastrum complanatum TaxID=34168 RepID=A0ACC2B0W3_DIPCM|nr:hypothetical protein O6H91_18G049800 [Diphasiastrum complanatum]KAJ7523394.1 hypothetical protein O6H91_18G049800 [Diphasiastrum complanatum]KAJ7523396.1 hypothetical protein O6H91_18G049800 [Diphasiastrum complanatum]